MFYIGCHLSPSAGLRAMGETAVSLGATTLQFFTRTPRGRCVTAKAYEHLGLPVPGGAEPVMEQLTL